MVTYVKISELPPATEATGDSELEVNQAGVTRRITVDQIADVVAGILPPPDMSDYATDAEVADAIAAIPDPAWTDITGKPSTFPPTVPIAWTDVSGKPATFPPGGTAGGDLSGTYPNPLIRPGTNTQILTTVGGAATWAAAPSSAPSGTAGGDLSGTYPNPTIKSAVALAGAPTTTTAPTADSTTKIATTAFVKAQNYITSSGIPASLPPSGAATGDLTGTYPAPTIKADVALSGNPTTTTQAAGNSTTRIATTAFVTTALAAGASIAVGTTPPGSPSANALWWNSDASVGGGQMFIFYDGFWVPASPGVGSGAVVQTVSYQTGAMTTGTTIVPYDDTIPQITEGFEVMTLAITPRSATSTLLVDVTCVLAFTSASQQLSVLLFQDSTANALAAVVSTVVGINAPTFVRLAHKMTAGTTSATTFRVRVGCAAAGTVTFNGSNATRVYGGVMASSIVIQEVL